MISKEGQAKHTRSRKLKKALNHEDPCMCLFYLKSIPLNSNVLIDEKTASRLLNLIRKFISCDFPIKTDFGEFIDSFLRKMTMESSEMHIRCLSIIYYHNLIQNRDEHLQYYRSIFSYTKIYSIFKEQVKGVFSDGIEPEFFEYLIALLNNNKLVYKHLLPVIQKISMFVDQNIVDKSIVNCCILIRSIMRIHPENFKSMFLVSIATYLIDVLLDSQNFIFIDFIGAKMILKTIQTQVDIILNSKEIEIDLKKISFGLMRKLVDSIKKYRHSTVYEEAMIVLSATNCMEPIFKLFIKFENRNIDFIDSDLLSFVLFERSKTNQNNFQFSDRNIKKSTPHENSIKKASSNENIVKLDFERPFKNHYNAHYQMIRDEFIVSKYKFLDLFWSVTQNINNGFKRIEFYNDLTKIEESHKLFSVIKNIKKDIDWSDMIVFACNAPNKDNYIPFIFDEYFINNQGHKIFLEIFFKSMQNSPIDLVYFTKYCINARIIDLLAKLYLVDLDRNENPFKKRREMIIRFIALLGSEENNKVEEIDDFKLIKSKEMNMITEEHPIDGNLVEKIKTIEIKEILNPIENNENTDDEKVKIDIDIAKMQESQEINIFVETLSEELMYLHQNLIPLLIVLMYKKINNQILIKYLEKMNLMMNKKKEDDRFKNESIVSVFSIYCCIYRMNYFKDHEIVTNKDLFVSMMCLKLGDFDEENVNILKIKSFDLMMNINDDDITIGKEIYNFENEENKYVSEIKSIIELLHNK